MNCTVHSVRHRAGQRTRLLIALTLAVVVFAVEATASIFANSLALLAEAFHVLIDVVALGIAFVALWLGSRPVTDRRTFGLLRLEILATVLNTVLLLVVAAVVLVEGLRRFSEPSQVQSGLVLAVAAVGLVSNGVSIYLLRDPQASLAVRAAYLDVLADVAASIAVIVSALANILAGRQLADTFAAFLIVALIVPRSFSLLREAIDVLLEATPRDVNVDTLREHERSERDLSPRGHAARGGSERGPRRPGDMPSRRLRHRALDLPARDRGSEADRERRAPVTARRRALSRSR